MPRRRTADAVAIRFDVVDRPAASAAVTAAVADLGGLIRTLATVRPIDGQTGAITMVADDVEGPNGLAFSPDESKLYVVESRAMPTRKLRVFEQQDLELVRGRIGYLPERLRYHLRYSGREYLRYLGRFSDLRGFGPLSACPPSRSTPSMPIAKMMT